MSQCTLHGHLVGIYTFDVSDEIIDKQNENKRDPRKTFITRCKKANVDEFALKEMVGHSIRDITESTYTERDLEWLRADLEKMQ